METEADILLIEDDPFMRELVSLSLRDAGYRVAEFSGQGWLFLLEAFAARVVIVDVSDPKSGSRKVIDALRVRFPAASIVAISGYFHAGPAMAGAVARQLGVDRALAKPFGSSELVGAVKALLG
ncbi:response regulator [Paraburkholderia sp. MM5477-R1]|uniref:response regulator n=1 Tax=Paraburkholderia sp. MM5477-R1 TaxID=2991062 RepID=UPI003D1ED31D